MIAAVSSLKAAEGTERYQDGLILALQDALPGAAITDLIYYADVKRTAEGIVDEALRRVKADVIHLGYAPPQGE